MMEWFQAGGFGMILILAIGAGAIGYGARATKKPTKERVAALRGLPMLLVVSALFSFGTNMWAVNRYLSKAGEAAGPSLPVIGFIGVTEAAQAITLGGLLAMIVVALRVVAEARLARE